MPRWLVVSLIAFMLSCLGFAAVAHSSANSPDDGGSQSTHVQHDLSACESPVDDAEDASSGSNCTEAATGAFQGFLALLVSQPVPQPVTTAKPSPFLALPKRPPREHAFIL